MRVCSILAAGVAGAANGTATLYKRGGSAAAPYYTDFEGSAQVSSTNVVSLDSYGRALVYFDQLVNVVVKDANGTQILDFVDADHAGSIELISKSFTGKDYEDGESGASKPTTLQAQADLWFETYGCLDWKIKDANGTCRSITEALQSLGGNCYLVTNDDFAGGAEGDGSTDDYDAIAAAIAQATADGGGTVCFPSGTYRVTQTLVVPENVNLRGVGSHPTILRMDSASNLDLLQFDGDTGVDRPQYIQGLRLEQHQASTGRLAFFTDAKLLFMDCYFDGADCRTLVQSDTEVNTTEFALGCVRCEFSVEYATASAISQQVTTPSKVLNAFLHDCQFSTTNTDWGETTMVTLSPCIVRGCVFDTENVTQATNTITSLIALKYGGVVSGCRFLPGSLDTEAIDPPDDADPYLLVESGNEFGFNSGTSAYMDPFVEGVNYDTVQHDSLQNRWLHTYAHIWGTTFTAKPSKFGVEKVSFTSSGPTAYVLTGDLIDGSEYTLMVHHEAGAGAHTVTWTGGLTANATESVAQNQLRTFKFLVMDIDGTKQMVQINDSGDIADT